MKRFKETRVSFIEEEINILDDALSVINDLLIFMNSEKVTSAFSEDDNVYFSLDKLEEVRGVLSDLIDYPELILS